MPVRMVLSTREFERMHRNAPLTLAVALAVLTTACGGDGSTGPTERETPTVTVASPEDGSTYVEGAAVEFSGSATDAEDVVLSGESLVWTSDLDGQIGTGSDFTSASLSVGEHVVRLTATDSHGASATDEVVLIMAANQAPMVEMTSPEDGSTYVESATVEFTGSATDAEDGALSGASLVWTSDLDGQIGTGSDFTSASLSVGEHIVRLTATDSHGASATEQVVLTVTVNQAPTVSVTWPEHGTTFVEGSTVTFSGSANDPEDGALSGESLVWTSSLDGQIGTGPDFTSASLSVGEHVVRLTATDSHGASATEQVALTVTANQAPTVSVTWPEHGTTYVEGSTVTFSGSATDAEDGALSGESLVWTSSLDGQIGTGSSFTSVSLSVGEHVVRLTATDSHGNSATDEVVLIVTANQAPAVEMSSPEDGNTYVEGDTVEFTGSATDAEDGALSGESLVWTSDLDGQIGTRSGLASTTLSVGEHVIRLTATDSHGDSATDEVVVTVAANQPPTVSVSSPEDGSTYVEGDTVEFSGSASDPEDGALSGGSLVWTSDLDGQIGTGSDFTSSSLSVGEHAIRLTATDSHGDTSTVTFGMVVADRVGIGLGSEEFVLIEAGQYPMGATTGYGSEDELPRHTVNITNAFSMQRTEVTQAQWLEVMGSNPSYFTSCGATCPVENVSWNDVQEFIDQLNERYPDAHYRLPTEAEWEYAARAGTTGAYGGTGDLYDMGWCSTGGVTTHPVAEKQANHWGLFDMHGNVAEWVSDWYQSDYYSVSPTDDPPGPASGSQRVTRGGWYGTSATGCRSAARNHHDPTGSRMAEGFRLVRAQ